MNNSIEIKDYHIKENLKDKSLFTIKGLNAVYLDKLAEENIKAKKLIF